ncbi:MAG TPA: hypothetical protein DEO40_03170, partial [Treponema sp.]|nr:hypothetical protein [Treponema sp.]
EIGAKIAEKWNFPPVISNVIRYHHEPNEAPDEQKKLASIIYMADLLAHDQDGSAGYFQGDTEIMQQFSIQSEEDFNNLSDKLNKAFRREKR